MELTENKKEIVSTRKKGLGGSDAKMVYKIGLKGLDSLSETDKLRLAVMTGQVDYKPTYTTDAMERGNEFEAWLAENVFPRLPNNPLMELKDNPYSFGVFAHADFLETDPLDIESKKVFEAKCTSVDIYKTQIDYFSQLQWYYMLGAKYVKLVHHYNNSGFERFEDWAMIETPKDSKYIETLHKGLRLINDFIVGWVYEPREEWHETDLLEWDKADAVAMYSALREIERLEQIANDYKERLKKLFEDNNVKSLKSDDYTITYVPEGVTQKTDTKKLFEDNPTIDKEAYNKKSVRKSYLKISLK
jgi:hypothetical protein